MTPDIIFGSCLCSSVTYEVRKPYLRLYAHCYCGRCRKATGSSHATNLYVEPRQFSWLVGEHLTKRFDLPRAQSFATTVCGSCGGPLPHFTREWPGSCSSCRNTRHDAGYPAAGEYLLGLSRILVLQWRGYTLPCRVHTELAMTSRPPNNRFGRSRVASSVSQRGGVDDWDKVPSFDAGETPRRSASSLEVKLA